MRSRPNGCGFFCGFREVPKKLRLAHRFQILGHNQLCLSRSLHLLHREFRIDLLQHNAFGSDVHDHRHVQAVLLRQIRDQHVRVLFRNQQVRRLTPKHRRHRQELRAQHAQVHRQARRKATAASQAAARRQVQEVTRHQAVADRAAVRLHVQVTQAHRIRVLQVRQDRAIPALLAQAVRARHIQEVHLLTHQEDS